MVGDPVLLVLSLERGLSLACDEIVSKVRYRPGTFKIGSIVRKGIGR